MSAPDRNQQLTDQALDWLQSTFARTVALKLTPVLLPILGGLSYWLQNVLGIDMNPSTAAAFVVSVVVGAAGAAAVYVHNHGRGAALIGQALLELERLYESGTNELNSVSGQAGGQGPTPVVPPGLQSDR